jgi:hypothetical protein
MKKFIKFSEIEIGMVFNFHGDEKYPLEISDQWLKIPYCKKNSCNAIRIGDSKPGFFCMENDRVTLYEFKK